MSHKGMIDSNPALPFEIKDWAADLDPEKAAGRLLSSANEGNRRALAWVKRFANDGVTDSMINQIGAKLRQVEMTARLFRVPTARKFEWRLRLADPGQLTDEVFILLLAMTTIGGGLASRIKKCDFDACKHPYFFGNAKAKYCSDKCGSNVRVRKMRNSQKARQML